MEGFKNKLVNEGLKVTENDNGITHVILRELAEVNDDFKGAFGSLTKERQEFILNLGEKAEIINRKWEVVTREKTSYDLPSFRETPYEMVKHVMPDEKLKVSEEDYSALFSKVTVDTQQGLAEVKKDFIGPPEAPKVENNEMAEEIKPFNLADFDLAEVRKSPEAFTRLVDQILDTDTPGQTIDTFVENSNKVEVGYGKHVDQNQTSFMIYTDALQNTPDPDMSRKALEVYIAEGDYLNS